MSATRSWRRRRMGRSRSPSIPAPAGGSVCRAGRDSRLETPRPRGPGGGIGGRGVRKQVFYERGTPAKYIPPDCFVDSPAIRLEQHGKDRVRVSGVRGRPATDKLKVSIGYFYGYKAVGTMGYAGPAAYPKAQAADRIFRHRLAHPRLKVQSLLT